MEQPINSFAHRNTETTLASGHNFKEVFLAESVILTGFRRTEGCRAQAPVGHAGLPGGTAAPAPDAADPRPSFYAALLCQEGPAARGSVHEHVVEQHPREATEHIHGPGLEGRGTRTHISKAKKRKKEN